MLRIYLHATFFQEEAPYTVAVRFVKWKHDNIFQDLTGSGGEWYHAVSNYITLGFFGSFFLLFSLADNFFLCFCSLFFLPVLHLDKIKPLLLFVFSQVDRLWKNGNDLTQVAARPLWLVARVSWVVTRELSGGVWV